MSAPFPDIETVRRQAIGNTAEILARTEQVLDDLDGLGKQLNAVAYVARSDALAHAGKIAGEDRQNRPLYGIPLAHKDLYMREGWPCEGGSKTLAGHRAARTAGAIRRLEAAGAIDCGRLTSVEFGLGPTGHNSYAGTPTNPWNPAYICGGSSSGSGAAVAAGIVPAALGTDTGGSVRLPAAACGLVGIKPTHGLVGRSGIIALSPTLDSAGPLTRSVRDGAIMLAAIAGPDKDDAISIPCPGVDFLRDIEAGLQGIRIGWPRNHFFEKTEASIADSVQQVFRLAGRLGAACLDIALPEIENANAMNMLITAVEANAMHEQAILTRHGDFEKQSLSRVLAGAFIPGRDYHDAIACRGTFARKILEKTFAHVDAVMTPVWPFPIPTIAESDLGAKPDAAKLVFQSGHNVRPANYLGFPAVVLPVGFDANGLPASVQLIGPPFTEGTLLQIARALEREIDFWSVTPAIVRC